MKWFHRHQWQEVQREYIDKQHFTSQAFSSKEVGERATVTVITFKCECFKYKQKTLEGSIGKEAAL